MTIPTKPNPNIAQDKILAEHYNDTRDLYNYIWEDNNSNVNFQDSDRSEHKFGWGQNTVVPNGVNSSTVITANEINELTYQVNAGVFHVDQSISLVPRTASVSTQILHSQLNTINNTVEQITGANFGTSNWNKVNTKLYDCTNKQIVAVSQNTTRNNPWQDRLTCIAKYTFSDYNQCRYFFNTGGKITIDLSQTGGLGVWDFSFNRIGIISIGAIETTTDGIYKGISIGCNGSNGGFYGICNTYEAQQQGNNPSDYTQLWNATAFSNILAYSAYSAYSAYTNYGQYIDKRIEVWAKVVESPGSFDIYIEVRLIEDADDGIITGIFEADFGYEKPQQAPSNVQLNGSSGSAVGNPGTQYIFDPTLYNWDSGIPVAIHQPWTT